MINAPDFLEDIINADIEVTVRKDYETGVIGFDLNSQAKSGMFLFNDPEDGQWKIKGRYNFAEDVEVVEDLDDVMYIFLKFYRMRNFGNRYWLELLCEHGVIEKQIKTSVKYI